MSDPHRLWWRRAGMAAFAAVLFVVSAAGAALIDLQGQITRVDTEPFLSDTRTTRPTDIPLNDDYEGRAVNILVLGSDTREGENNVDDSAGSKDVEGARSDTALVVHISADRSRMDVVSIPRDTMTAIPSCVTVGGGHTAATKRGQFNSAFMLGAGTSSNAEAITAGASCTIRTVEEMTGLFIDDFVVVDFSSLEKMIDSLGGVNVWLDAPIKDAQHTGLELDMGCQHLNGEDGLAYARARYGAGDGSDLSRIGRQQMLMSAMLNAAKNKNLLTSADQLYGFARTALGSLTTSSHIGSLPTLAGLAMSTANLGLENVDFVTMPTVPDKLDPNRVQPSAQAAAVWEALKKDEPVPDESVTVTADGSTPAPAEAPAAPQEQPDTADQAETQDGGADAGTDAGTAEQPSPEPDPKAVCLAQ